MPRETIVLRDAPARRAQLTVGAVRLLVVVVAALLASVADRPGRSLAWLLPTVMLGGLAVAQRHTGWLWRWAVIVELVLAAGSVPVTGGSRSPMLVYLLGPLFGIGFRGGARLVVVAGSAAGGLLLSALPLDVVPANDTREYLISAAQWVVLGVMFGLVASWARVLAGSEDPAVRYAQVSRLLAELRAMARRLPGSLDPVSAAETLLDECKEVTAYDRGGVLLATSSERLTPIFVRGAERLDHDTSTSGNGHVAVAWQSGAAVRETGRQVRTGMASLLVVPLPAEEGCTGLLLLEAATENAFPPGVVQQVGQLAIAAAPRLESALLFDEIRRIATVEERQRVAREIHDGIAQELVYVGYELDALGAELDAKKPAARDSVKRTREHITRIISELRLSIFTLRTAPEPGGLGAALGEYVRSVAGAAGIAVHLALSEDPARLPADAEAELLRIAQEAVTNARKHSKARNLWVTLNVDPPHVLLRVEDDGLGFATGGRRGFGLDIMKERAERLGATLRVTQRQPTGTRVEVEVGGGSG